MEAAAVGAHLALYACAGCRDDTRCSLIVPDEQSWVQDCCCLPCWQVFAVRLACFRLAEPSDESRSMATRWIVLRGFGSVVMGVHSMDCGAVAAEYTFRLW